MHIPLDPAAKKAYEVGYAVFRVAAILPSRHIAEVLEQEALELLRATAGDMPEEASRSLRTLSYLVSFGKDTGGIPPENAEILVSQMDVLGTLLHDAAMSEITPADLSDIFTASENAASTEAPRSSGKKTPSAISAEERQQMILDKIRQSGNCRTRDLQEILPDLSERTLRYDLQRLVEEGKIERGGPGGPASWYKARP